MRIIGGQWRSRRLPIADVPGLRPTGDRVRETLFNWLAPWLPGSRCVDLYAGAGALGLEAASRGAASVALVEIDRRAADGLKASVAALEAEQVEVIHADALSWLDRQSQAFDIVFLDPPFELDVGAALDRATAHLADRGWLYLERPATAQLALSSALEVHRDRTFGDVRALLLRRTAQIDN